jgi:glycosyltransferase involved in cell wall biosynthesis
MAEIIYPPYFLYLLSLMLLVPFWVLKCLLISARSPINLIHAQDTGYSGLAAVLSGRLLGIPVIISSHGIRHQALEWKVKNIHGRINHVLFKIEYAVDFFTTKRATAVIAVNPLIKKYFQQRTSSNVVFIPNCIRIRDFQFSPVNRILIREELEIEEKTIVVGYVGRLAPEKNLITLLNSFASIKQNDPLIKLVLIGSGPQELQLKQLAISLGVQDRIIFCGTRTDVANLLSCFDIFVLPSYVEGLSTSLLEVMASGRAIICSNIAANHELLRQNEEALFVDPCDPEELRLAIQLLSKDEALRSRLVNNAKNKISQYDEEVIFRQVLQLYKTYTKVQSNR